MNEIKAFCLTLGPVMTNCYILINTGISKAVVIDPADDGEKIEQSILEQNAVPACILLTHGHFDHIGAVRYLKDKYNIDVFAMEQERKMLASPDINMSSYQGRIPVSLKADRYLKDGELIECAGISFRVLHTPGHTKGGCCYYAGEQALLFSGDTLFEGSVGRTDFPGGSMEELLCSIREKLLVLPDDTNVLPGHGGFTTIGREKKYNVWINER